MPRNLYKKVKILSPCLYPFRVMAWFKVVSQRSKVWLAAPVGKYVIFKMALLTLKAGIKAYDIKSNVIVMIKILFQPEICKLGKRAE